MIPAGYRLVPEVATPEMAGAHLAAELHAEPDGEYNGEPTTSILSCYRAGYAAAIAAAPPPPSGWRGMADTVRGTLLAIATHCDLDGLMIGNDPATTVLGELIAQLTPPPEDRT